MGGRAFLEEENLNTVTPFSSSSFKPQARNQEAEGQGEKLCRSPQGTPPAMGRPGSRFLSALHYRRARCPEQGVGVTGTHFLAR